MSTTYILPTTISFLARRAEYELRELEAEIAAAERALSKVRADRDQFKTADEYEQVVVHWTKRVDMLKTCLPGRQKLYDRWWSRNQAGTV